MQLPSSRAIALPSTSCRSCSPTSNERRRHKRRSARAARWLALADASSAKRSARDGARPEIRRPGRDGRRPRPSEGRATSVEYRHADMGGSRRRARRRSGASFRADAADAIHLPPGSAPVPSRVGALAIASIEPAGRRRDCRRQPGVRRRVVVGLFPSFPGVASVSCAFGALSLPDALEAVGITNGLTVANGRVWITDTSSRRVSLGEPCPDRLHRLGAGPAHPAIRSGSDSPARALPCDSLTQSSDNRFEPGWPCLRATSRSRPATPPRRLARPAGRTRRPPTCARARHLSSVKQGLPRSRRDATYPGQVLIGSVPARSCSIHSTPWVSSLS